MWSLALMLPLLGQTPPSFWDLQYGRNVWYRMADTAADYSAAFALADLLTYELSAPGGKAPADVSEEFLIWAQRQAAGGQVTGYSLPQAAAGLEAYGVCDAALTPKLDIPQPYDPTFAPSAEAIAKAAERKTIAVEWLKQWDPASGMTEEMLTAIKCAIADGHPVAVTVLWPKNERILPGMIYDTPGPDQVVLGRSVMLLRYNDEYGSPVKGLFLSQNHVRASTGGAPQINLSFDYLRKYGVAALRVRLPNEKPVSNAALAAPLEAETLKVETATDCTPEVQDMTPYGRERWSGGAQLLCRSGEHGSITFLLPAKEKGRYSVWFCGTRAPDYGMVRAYVGNEIALYGIDLYRSEVAPTGPIPLPSGTVLLTPGDVKVRFEMRDKNRHSTGRNFGIDCLELRRLVP